MPDRDDTANEPLRGPDILGIVLGLIVIAGLVLGFIVSAGHSYDALTSPDSDDAGPAPVLGQWAMVPPPPGVLPPPPGAPSPRCFQLHRQIHVPTTGQVCW